MVDKNASMYLGSPRMAEMVIGERVSLEEMGGARMHCSVSGCGDFLAKDEEEAILLARQYLSYFPANYAEKPPVEPGKDPRSEEHTSELQSRENLVCRLLLEKKNNTIKHGRTTRS